MRKLFKCVIYVFKRWGLVSEIWAREMLRACFLALCYITFLDSEARTHSLEWDVDCQCVTNKKLSPQISKPDIFAKTIAISYISFCISYSSHTPEKQCMTSFIMIYASVWTTQEYLSRFAINQLKMFINKANE